MTDAIKNLWESLPGWSDAEMRACYDQIAREAPEDSTIVEVGTYLGRSLCYLCHRLREEKKERVKVISVDLFPSEVLVQMPSNCIQCDWSDGSLSIVQANVMQGGFQKMVTFIRGDSADSAALVSESLFACYIDADHTYEGVLRDVRAWLPKVQRGGIFAGHDYGAPGTDGVKMAVDEILGAQNVKQNGTTWFYRVPQS